MITHNVKHGQLPTAHVSAPSATPEPWIARCRGIVVWIDPMPWPLAIEAAETRLGSPRSEIALVLAGKLTPPGVPLPPRTARAA